MSKFFEKFEQAHRNWLENYFDGNGIEPDSAESAVWAFKWIDSHHLKTKWKLMTERDLLISSIKQAKEILGDDCGYLESCGCASCRAYNVLDQFLEKKNV